MLSYVIEAEPANMDYMNPRLFQVTENLVNIRSS